MLAIHVNYSALKRTMRHALMSAFLIALFGMVEQAARLCKATRFVGRHNGLLAQDTIRQVGGIGIEPQQRHDKKHRRTQQKAKAVKLLRLKQRHGSRQPGHTRKQPRGQHGPLVVGKVKQDEHHRIAHGIQAIAHAQRAKIPVHQVVKAQR